MAVRTTRSVVTFSQPFRLPGLDDALPAGTYDIDTEEEIIEGNERSVYLRTATRLFIRTPGRVEIMTIDPHQIQAALARDRTQR